VIDNFRMSVYGRDLARSYRAVAHIKLQQYAAARADLRVLRADEQWAWRWVPDYLQTMPEAERNLDQEELNQEKVVAVHAPAANTVGAQ